MITSYTALLTGNRRGVETLSPMALLLNIEGFRDHCWVKLTTNIQKLQPLGHKKPIKVIITAHEIDYLSRGETASKTLQVLEIKKYK